MATIAKVLIRKLGGPVSSAEEKHTDTPTHTQASKLHTKNTNSSQPRAIL
jgi:hypothetical protein